MNEFSGLGFIEFCSATGIEFGSFILAANRCMGLNERERKISAEWFNSLDKCEKFSRMKDLLKIEWFPTFVGGVTFMILEEHYT